MRFENGLGIQIVKADLPMRFENGLGIQIVKADLPREITRPSLPARSVKYLFSAHL